MMGYSAESGYKFGYKRAGISYNLLISQGGSRDFESVGRGFESLQARHNLSPLNGLGRPTTYRMVGANSW